MTLERLPDRERKETVKQTYEYRDPEDRLLAKVMVELAATEAPESMQRFQPTDCVLLKKLFIKGPNQEDPEVDLLSLANPNAIPIFLAHARNYAYFESPTEESILAPPLETAHGLGALLHEIGHSAQRYHPVLRALGQRIGQEKTPEAAEKIHKLIVNAKLPLTEQERARLQSLSKEYWDLMDEFRSLFEQSKSQGVTSEQHAALMRRMEEIEARGQEIEVEISKGHQHERSASQIYNIPVLVLERDATLRAVRWLRFLKQHAHIDLIREIYTRNPRLSEEQKSQERLFGHLFTLSRLEESSEIAKHSLYEALFSYCATSVLMRERYQGEIPSPKSLTEVKPNDLL